ncbi:hypothetical protein AMTRI_Chr03g50500 [Amborella trichopoda]
MSVAEMKMLRWMSGRIRRNIIQNEFIQENLGVAPIGDQMRESRLRWAYHVWCRPSTTPVRRCELVQVEGLKRARGRPKWMYLEVVQKDMEAYGLTEGMVFNSAEWRTKMCVSDPNYLGKGYDNDDDV